MERVINEIKRLNAESAAWMAEAEGRWAGMLTEDPEHWAGYGITTVEELHAYFDACAEREAYKAMLAGDDDDWRTEEWLAEEEAAYESEKELYDAAGPYGDYEDLTDPCNWG